MSRHKKRNSFKIGNQIAKGHGRPKGSGLSITTAIRRKLMELDPKNIKENATYITSLVDVIIESAIENKSEKMIKQIWNYIDGLPKAKVEYSEVMTMSSILDQINEDSDKDQNDKTT